jgi:hypothetical protein
VKASWQILARDRKLLVFPVLSGIVTLFLAASFILPLFISGVIFRQVPGGGIPWYVLLFLFYVVSYFVAIFFNTALVTCVHSLLQGRETSLGEGLSHAVRHAGSILLWAIIAATVGIVLRAIGERSGILGRIAVAVVGGIWSLVTIFVVPVLVLEDRGVFDAMRESVALFRRTWGESVVGSVSIGVISGAITLVGLLGVFAAVFTGSLAVMILAIAPFSSSSSSGWCPRRCRESSSWLSPATQRQGPFPGPTRGDSSRRPLSPESRPSGRGISEHFFQALGTISRKGRYPCRAGTHFTRGMVRCLTPGNPRVSPGCHP